MKWGNCLKISATVNLKKNILGFGKFSDYIKRQFHYWNVPMIMLQNTQTIVQRCFLKKCSAYILQNYGRIPMRKNDFNKVAMWNHTFALLISCKSSVYLQNIFFEEHHWGRTFENIYCSGQSKSALWKHVDLRMMLFSLSRETKFQNFQQLFGRENSPSQIPDFNNNWTSLIIKPLTFFNMFIKSCENCFQNADQEFC